jgi:hypothetical protein
VALVHRLPALRNEAVRGYQEEGVELIPRAKQVKYFAQPNGVGDEMLEDLRWWIGLIRRPFEPCCAEIIRAELAGTMGTLGTAFLGHTALNTSSRRL